jgi:2-C-methyl-D-erythritol 4-phosphate cytidylyltransferase
MNIAIILCSGEGDRYSSNVPKQYCKLNGKPVSLYVLEEVIKSKLFDKIIVVVNSLRYKYLFDPYNVIVIKGGFTRNLSIGESINYISNYLPETRNVLFLDGVRPLIKASDLSQYIITLDNGAIGAITTEKVTDSLWNVKRELTCLVQTPEAFDFEILKSRFNPKANYTAIYEHLKPAINEEIVHIELGHPNYKITYQYDLYMLEHLIKYNQYKSSMPNLQGKNILLLGSTGGIGKEVYSQLKQFQPLNIYCPLHSEIDLSTYFVDKLRSKYTSIDVIINCAGIAIKDEAENYDIQEKIYNQTFDINVKAHLQLVNFAERQGRLINIVTISSSSVTKGRPGYGIYSASKIALQSLIEAQSEALASLGIFVNCICPERVGTPMAINLHGKINTEETLTVAEVAQAILSYSDVKIGGQIIYLRRGF